MMESPPTHLPSPLPLPSPLSLQGLRALPLPCWPCRRLIIACVDCRQKHRPEAPSLCRGVQLCSSSTPAAAAHPQRTGSTAGASSRQEGIPIHQHAHTAQWHNWIPHPSHQHLASWPSMPPPPPMPPPFPPQAPKPPPLPRLPGQQGGEGGPPCAPQGGLDSDEELSELLMAWYYAGFQTGRRAGLKEGREEAAAARGQAAPPQGIPPSPRAG